MLMRSSSCDLAMCQACSVPAAVPVTTDCPFGCQATDSRRPPSRGMLLLYTRRGRPCSAVNSLSVPSSHATATLEGPPEVRKVSSLYA